MEIRLLSCLYENLTPWFDEVFLRWTHDLPPTSISIKGRREAYSHVPSQAVDVTQGNFLISADLYSSKDDDLK